MLAQSSYRVHMQSRSYTVERGVRQGSVLSPVLFLMVMDPLLRRLEESGMGLSVNSYYAGWFLHADDIRTLTSSSTSLGEQIVKVEEFASQNYLKLNAQKCEVVVFSEDHASQLPECSIDGVVVPVSDTRKCLGYWWKGDLMATRAVHGGECEEG